MSMRDRTKQAAEKGIVKRPRPILALQRELRGRFISSGGRPSDPAPTIRRLVTLKRQVWKDLQHHAALLSRLGQRVSPGQLSAMLLERSLSEIESPLIRK